MPTGTGHWLSSQPLNRPVSLHKPSAVPWGLGQVCEFPHSHLPGCLMANIVDPEMTSRAACPVVCGSCV